MTALPLIGPLSDWLDDAFGFRADVLGRAIWRDLACRLLDGSPVDVDALAAANGCPSGDVRSRLEAWPCTQWEAGRVRGSIATLDQTRHRVSPGREPVYTWCAFDAFMLAPLGFGVTHLSTTCVRTGQALTILLDGSGDEPCRVSVPRRPVPGADLRSAFCCRSNAARSDSELRSDADVEWLTPRETAQVARGVVAALGLLPGADALAS